MVICEDILTRIEGIQIQVYLIRSATLHGRQRNKKKGLIVKRLGYICTLV